MIKHRLFFTGTAVTHGLVRVLGNGGIGKVEVSLYGHWVSVCGKFWTDREATVTYTKSSNQV